MSAGNKTLVLAIIFSLAIPLALLADTIYLKDGRQLEGEILEDSGDYIKVKMKYGTLKVAKKDIERIEQGKSVRQLYEEKAAALKEDDLEGHFQLALWCEENGLFKERNQHLEHVILLEPDHNEAREKLGYEFVDGQWMKLDELEPVVDEENPQPTPGEEEKVAEPPTPDTLEILRKLEEGTPEQRMEALLYLSNSPKSIAIPPLMDLLKSEKDELLRPLIKDTLKRFRSSEVCPHLFKIALADETPASLDAVEILESLGDGNAFRALTTIYLGDFGDAGQRAHLALWRNREKAVPVMSRFITSGKQTPRLTMIKLAGQMREPGFVPALMTYIHADKETVYKEPGIEAIKKMGEPAVPYLIKFLGDPKRKVWANYLLKQIARLNINIGQADEWKKWWGENRERVQKQHEEWKKQVKESLDKGCIPPDTSSPPSGEIWSE